MYRRVSNGKGRIVALFIPLFIFLLLFVKPHSKTKESAVRMDLYPECSLISLCGCYAKNNNKNGIIRLTYIILFRLV